MKQLAQIIHGDTRVTNSEPSRVDGNGSIPRGSVKRTLLLFHTKASRARQGRNDRVQFWLQCKAVRLKAIRQLQPHLLVAIFEVLKPWDG
jgi:hypothetical protein